ncbi:MAG: CpsD/CapB family tyrosine-protein kinase, partial [Anaerolineae bacterium]
AEMIERDNIIDSFRAQVAEREAAVGDLKAQLSEKEEGLEGLRAEMIERDNIIDSFRAQVAEREAAVGDLKAQLRRSRPWVTVLDFDVRSSAGEAYQILRTSFLSLSSRIPKKMLLMTSVEPGVSKSRLLANLAVGMAEAGQRVVVIDGDLRGPSLHQVFDLSNELGLSDVILDRSRVDTALQETEIQGLRVLTSGPLPPNPAELLASPKMQELIWELAIEADMVLLDSPPILAAADAAVLAPVVDGVLLVAAQDQATEESIHRALQGMDEVGAKALGLVLDKAKAGDRDHHYPRHSYVTESAKPALEFGPRKRR